MNFISIIETKIKMSQNLRECLNDFACVAKLRISIREIVLKELSKDDKYYIALNEIAQGIINRKFELKDVVRQKMKVFCGNTQYWIK